MSTETPATRWATEPFVVGTAEQFARLRAWLTSVGFTEPALCAAANVRTLAHFRALESKRTVFREPVDVQSLLVQLYIDGELFPWDFVRSTLKADGFEALNALGLLQTSAGDAALCAAPVALFPYEGLFMIADRLGGGMEVIGDSIPSDLVYSPLTNETHRFIGMMPRERCENYLEMCGGSGIAALIAANEFADRAHSADITERSTRFAQFNGALNGLEQRFSAVCGDLYAPVADQTFDVISAHPPYVPAVETQMVFRDGGQDGEQITRRIIAGLVDYLRPGGLFYLDCFLTDRANTSLEERIRRMLGPSEDEFDVLLIRNGTLDPAVFHSDRLRHRVITQAVFDQQVQAFEELKIERFVAATVLIQRRATVRPVVTRHRMMSPETRAPDLLWALRYFAQTIGWGSAETDTLLDARPRTLPGTEVRSRSKIKDGKWVVVDARIATVVPFAVEAPCLPFLPALLAQCDGRVTAREHLGRLRASGDVPADKTDGDFAQLIRELADASYIELDMFPHPSRDASR